MGTTILLVDDSVVARKGLRAALITANFEVLEGDNGADGLRLAQTEAVDLIVVDLNMPVMDGMEMVRRVRALPEHENTPIFMLTSESLTLHAREAKVVGIDAWIVKPVKSEAFVGAVRRGLQLASQSRADTATEN